jgi:prolyl oligopeptidase
MKGMEDMKALFKKSFMLVTCFIALFEGCSRARVITTDARAPITRIAPVSETIHGTTVVDNYRWLEGDNRDPNAPAKMTTDVAAWTDEQNRYTRAVLDNLPGRKAIEDRLRPLMKVGSVSIPVMRGNRYFFAVRESDQDQPVIMMRQGHLGADQPLLDPHRLDPTGNTAVGWFSPSSHGSLVAYGVYRAMDAAPMLHLLDVETRKSLPLEIANTTQGVQWLPDDSGFVYQTQSNMSDPSTIEVRFHRLNGTGRDPLVYQGPAGALSRDGEWLVIAAPTSFTANNLWVASFSAFQKTGKLPIAPVAVNTGALASGTVIAGTLYLQTTKGAPNGRLVATDPRQPTEAHWQTIVPERQDAVIAGFTVGRGALAVTYRKNAATSIEVFDPSGKPIGSLELPGIGIASLAADENRTEAYVDFTSFNYPQTIFRVDLSTPATAPTLWMAADVAIDPASVDVDQVWYPSKDGTKISMFLAHKHGLARRGDAPTMLAGFGAFGIPAAPAFSATQFPWFDAGGVLAMPNLRGGGEYGDAWHAAGARENKKHTIEDFLAAAEWLIANGYTNSKKLAAFGSSHGALTVGAAITRRPDLFRAAVMLVPVTDLIRYDRLPEARPWIEEYGSSADPRQFAGLLAISPYHHVTPATPYPAVLMTALERGAAVHPLHARKMTAALQTATSSDRAAQPILLRVDREPATTPDALFSLQFHDLVDQRMFLLWQLGML